MLTIKIADRDQDSLLKELVYDKLKQSKKEIDEFRDEEQMKFFITLNSMEDEAKLESFKEREAEILKEIPLIQIMNGKLQAYDYTLSFPLKILIAAQCESPGAVVVMLSYLQIAIKEHYPPFKHINIQDFVMYFFPNGLITSQAITEVWDLIKIQIEKENGEFFSVNLIDFAKPYKSTKFAEQ